MNLLADELTKIKDHAQAEYPRESCGLIIAGRYHPCHNEAENPLQSFRINKNVLLEPLTSGKLDAVIHSHCYDDGPQKYDPRWPSTLDMQTWINMNIPWGITATNGRDETSEVLWLDDNAVAPLVGRDFVHGLHDCYSAVRDYFRTVLDIKLPNYARGMEWWYRGEDLYSANFEAAGFTEIPKEEVRGNDCCLFQVHSKVINHAAVITGPNQILHHLIHRLSGHDRLDKWDKHIVKYVRYTR